MLYFEIDKWKLYVKNLSARAISVRRIRNLHNFVGKYLNAWMGYIFLTVNKNDIASAS